MKKGILKDHIQQVRGVTYKSEDSIKEKKEGYLPILRSNNIEEGTLNFDDLVYVPNSQVGVKQLLRKGDILITASTGSLTVIGKNGQVREDYNGSFGAFCKVVRPLSSVDSSYLRFFFQTKYYRKTIQSVINGANINNIKNEHLNDLIIPLPPLDTQKKIAAILDAADAYRKKTKTLIEKYDQLAQSLFLDMFGDSEANLKGWKRIILNDGCNRICVGFVGICEPFYTTKENGIPMIRTGNLGEGFLRFENLKYVTREFHLKQKKSQIVKGDILIARHGDNGKAVLYNGEFENANCLNIVILRPGKSLHCLYVQFLLNSESIRRLIAGRTGGATQKVVNTKEIQKIIIPLPPITLQTQFAERIKLIKTQKQKAQASLQKAEDLFNSLLQKSFSSY